jgi:RNA polymerase sigma-70 factor (ECF subfamily)
MHESDRTAVARAGDGDSDSFVRVRRAHSRYVFSVAYRLTGSVEDAEDVVQNAFLKAYKQLSRFEARADFKTWLHRDHRELCHRPHSQPPATAKSAGPGRLRIDGRTAAADGALPGPERCCSARRCGIACRKACRS